jgi:hypothetical protein
MLSGRQRARRHEEFWLAAERELQNDPIAHGLKLLDNLSAGGKHSLPHQDSARAVELLRSYFFGCSSGRPPLSAPRPVEEEVGALLVSGAGLTGW